MPEFSPLRRDAALTLLVELLTQLFDIAPEKITPTTRLYQDLDIDSIDAVDLAIALKKRTGRQLTTEEFKQIHTVDDVLAALVQPESPAA